MNPFNTTKLLASGHLQQHLLRLVISCVLLLLNAIAISGLWYLCTSDSSLIQIRLVGNKSFLGGFQTCFHLPFQKEEREEKEEERKRIVREYMALGSLGQIPGNKQ